MFAKTILAAAAACASLVAGQGYSRHAGNATVVTTTKVVSAYTTYCPGPTVLAFQGKKYTALKAGYLTINDCPCTIVEPCYNCAGARPTPPVLPGKVAVPGRVPVAPVAPVAPVVPGKVAQPAVHPAKAAVAPVVGPAVQPGNGPVGPVAPVQTNAPAKVAPVAPTQNADKAGPAIEVAGAEGRHVAYTLAMVAAGVVGYLAL